MSFMYLVEFKGAVVESISYQARSPTPKSYVTSDKVTWYQSVEEKIVVPRIVPQITKFQRPLTWLDAYNVETALMK